MDHTSRTQKLFSLGYVAEGMASCKYHVFPPKSVLGSRSPSGTSWSHPGSSSRNASVGHPCILFSHAMANKDVHKQVRVCAIAATPAALVLRSATACFGFSDGTNPTRGGDDSDPSEKKGGGVFAGIDGPWVGIHVHVGPGAFWMEAFEQTSLLHVPCTKHMASQGVRKTRTTDRTARCCILSFVLHRTRSLQPRLGERRPRKPRVLRPEQLVSPEPQRVDVACMVRRREAHKVSCLRPPRPTHERSSQNQPLVSQLHRDLSHRPDRFQTPRFHGSFFSSAGPRAVSEFSWPRKIWILIDIFVHDLDGNRDLRGGTRHGLRTVGNMADLRVRTRSLQEQNKTRVRGEERSIHDTNVLAPEGRRTFGLDRRRGATWRWIAMDQLSMVRGRVEASGRSVGRPASSCSS